MVSRTSILFSNCESDSPLQPMLYFAYNLDEPMQSDITQIVWIHHSWTFHQGLQRDTGTHGFQRIANWWRCIFQNDLTVSEPLLLFWELSTVCCWSVASKVSFLVAIIYLLTWLFVIKLLRLWPLFSLVQGVLFMYISAMKLYFVFSRMTSLSVSLFYSFVNYPHSASGVWLPKLCFWLP